MLSVHFIAQQDPAMDIVRELFLEYSNELNENLCFQGFDDELKDPLKKYGEPKGCLVLAFWNNEAAACIALQPLHQAGVCEMKRLFVRPQFRKLGIADELVKILLKEAVNKGYKKMVLDTLQKLQPAINLYSKYGFVRIVAYYDNPLNNVVYMEREL
jgi:putative acetyltransferase